MRREDSKELRSLAFAGVVFTLGLLAACNVPLTPEPHGQLPRSQGVPDGLSVPADYLTDMKILSYDSLENTRHWKSQPETGAVVNGAFVMQGTPFWHSHLSYAGPFHEGTGVVLSFEVQQANAASELVFVSGEWLTAGFRQFGFYNAGKPQADLFQGTDDLGGYAIMGDLVIRPNTWYGAALAIGHNGRLLALAWDPAEPARRAVFDLAAGANWTGRAWTFMPKANAGETLAVDNFYTITFATIR